MKFDRIALSATGCAAVLLLSACGGKEEKGSPAPVPSPAPTSAAASSPATSGTVPVSNADATAPGTELKVGERAVVPFKYGNDKSGTIAITVKAIELGPKEDLASYGEKAKGMTPVYIRMTVENVGGTDLTYSTVRMRAVGPNNKSTGVIITGETPSCQSESAKKDFKTAGATYETCELQAIRDGGEVGGAEFNDGDGYKDDPIIWKK
ncbi:hypothetical protein SAMN04489729_1268 [Amycolatopsis lurida]|uniref:Lipoprotein n=1 Tax=Amycolatopsis lurida NRRL 2430 TaxID=1460371 RepID=A0A2P2FZP8_AMYLU|nr:hypothetical protein [Amycolatopsis lurida]KFU82189.1 hypothetical protein BB31_04330 [Amycolatopsis lurida NRRL 2430]SEC30990.1 hypothetical protein SAMN04489729_1268 [Amycolatopsis lurida]